MEELNELALKARLGDEEAATSLVERCSTLINALASFFAAKAVLASKEDLVQEACVGLLKAVERYNIEADASFKTYAIPWMKKYVREAVRRDFVAHVPERHYLLLNKIKKFMASYHALYGEQPQNSTIAQYLEKTEGILLSEADIYSLLHINNAVKGVSLNQKIHDEERELGEMIPDLAGPMEENVIRHFTNQEMRKIIENTLNSVEKEYVKLRFGLDDGLYRTQSDLAPLYGHTTTTPLQELEAVIIGKLRPVLKEFVIS